jgi:hypothetical protein
VVGVQTQRWGRSMMKNRIAPRKKKVERNEEGMMCGEHSRMTSSFRMKIVKI